MNNKIYIDFDGTLVNTIKCIVDMYNTKYNQNIDWKTVKTWQFDELNLSTRDKIDKYFDKKDFFDKIEFMPFAEHTLDKLLWNGYEIVIVSMGNTKNLKLKEKWIEYNLPYCKFIGCDFKDYKDKTHIDMSDGIAFIDDSIENLLTSNCPRKICFGEVFPWNEMWQGERLYKWGDFNV